MNPKYATLFQTYTLNNGVTIKNRLVVAPMTHFGSQADGLISDQERTFLSNRAGDMGLFITAATLVQKDGKAFHGQPEATGEHCLDSLKETAQILQQQGAKAILQIHHGGSKAIDDLLDGLDKISASASASGVAGCGVATRWRASHSVPVSVSTMADLIAVPPTSIPNSRTFSPSHSPYSFASAASLPIVLTVPPAPIPHLPGKIAPSRVSARRDGAMLSAFHLAAITVHRVAGAKMRHRPARSDPFRPQISPENPFPMDNALPNQAACVHENRKPDDWSKTGSSRQKRPETGAAETQKHRRALNSLNPILPCFPAPADGFSFTLNKETLCSAIP